MVKTKKERSITTSFKLLALSSTTSDDQQDIIGIFINDKLIDFMRNDHYTILYTNYCYDVLNNDGYEIVGNKLYRFSYDPTKLKKITKELNVNHFKRPKWLVGNSQAQ